GVVGEAYACVGAVRGGPDFEPEAIPFVGDSAAPTQTLIVDGEPVTISALSRGTPPAVQLVDDVETAPVVSQGPLIERHADFPRGVNAGYMQVVDRANIRLRVWERGAGETLACGTGACAAVVAGIRRGLLDPQVRVQTRGGELAIRWDGAGKPGLVGGAGATGFEG